MRMTITIGISTNRDNAVEDALPGSGVLSDDELFPSEELETLTAPKMY